ncbi:MAG: MmgE/PrpD family protein [Thermodesulfobacteriota bacterium]|nr:MmgE/PrpD family protein [Thermodesulfobacteriota bacterium]
MEITKELSRYISQMRYPELPPEVVGQAKLCFLDWLGVTLGGSGEPLINILWQLLESQGGNRQATVIGRKEKTSLLHAALINGSASHALDFDDVHFQMMGHPSVPVFPALLALAEWKRSSGKDFITAFIAGFETECRIGAMLYPDHYMAGWHATGTIGHFGAAAACANLLRLNLSQTINALGIAGTQASGLQQVFGSMCKPFHAGKAAMNGLLASLLAERGFTSSQEMIEGEKGFSRVFSPKYDPSKALEGLGKKYAVQEVIFKRHASCYATHAPIEGILAIKEEYPLAPDQVEEIRLKVSPLAPEVAGKSAPQTGLEGKFSVPFCVALALADGDTGEAAFLDAKVHDPRLIAIRDMVKIESEASLSLNQCIVEIQMADGKLHHKEVDIQELSRDRGKTLQSLTRKLRSLASPILLSPRVDELSKKIQQLEEISEMGEITVLAVC